MTVHRERRRSSMRLGIALAVTTLVLSGLWFAVPAASSATPTLGLSMTTRPGLYPVFNPSVTDYVVRCDNAPVLLSMTVPPGMEVEVGGHGDYHRSFTTTVPLTTDSSFTVTALDLGGSGASSSYFVRCLPADFPDFVSSVSGHPQAEYYMVMAVPASLFGPTPAPVEYAALFDDDGVPVWWRAINDKAIDATLLSNGDAAEVSILHDQAEEYSLSGATTRVIKPNDGGGVDLHEVQLLPNGNYLLSSEVSRSDENLSFMGGPSSATVADPVIKEVAPDGTVVWSWDTAAHIPVTEADPSWWSTDIRGGAGGGLGYPGYDIYHFNSADELGNDVLISYRQLNAVYLVDKTTGAIVWKLGGTERSDGTNLTVVKDPAAPPDLAGQHDARFYGKGSITVHDDGTLSSRGPRAVRYQIDAATKTATLVEQITDPLVSSAFCCGSARKLPGGDWVIGWGFNNVVTEFNTDNQRQFLLQWTDPGFFNYRAVPVLPGVLSSAQLRADMNAYAASG